MAAFNIYKGEMMDSHDPAIFLMSQVIAMKHFAPVFFTAVALAAEPGGVPAGKPVQNQPPAESPASPPAALEAGALGDGAVGKSIRVKLPGDEEMKLCYCPPGSFMMGSPEGEAGHIAEENQVSVRITRGFWMARTEFTQGQWEALMAGNPSGFKGAKLPVECVSWDDVQSAVAKLNATVKPPAGWEWSLPSEAQWEYACRAGSKTAFAFGDTLTSAQANLKESNLEKTTEVSSYAPNAWGIHDMHGNVWEWCLDYRGEKMAGGADPTGPAAGTFRVFRGGSWDVSAGVCRSARRSDDKPGVQYDDLGFRPVLVQRAVNP